MAGKQLAGDVRLANIAGMSKNQLYDIMSQMKNLLEQNRQQARQILIQNTLLTKSTTTSIHVSGSEFNNQAGSSMQVDKIRGSWMSGLPESSTVPQLPGPQPSVPSQWALAAGLLAPTVVP